MRSQLPALALLWGIIVPPDSLDLAPTRKARRVPVRDQDAEAPRGDAPTRDA
jgi:hypothetical protein